MSQFRIRVEMLVDVSGVNDIDDAHAASGALKDAIEWALRVDGDGDCDLDEFRDVGATCVEPIKVRVVRHGRKVQP